MLVTRLLYDPDTNSLLVQVPAAEGEGNVTLAVLDVKPLSANDRQRLRHLLPGTRPDKPGGA